MLEYWLRGGRSHHGKAHFKQPAKEGTRPRVPIREDRGNPAQALPTTHFITISRAVMLKALGVADLLPDVTILGVGILIVMAWMILNETRQQRAALEERLTLLQGQVSTLANKVDAAAKARVQPARPSGPDPNKVYAVKTEGAPVEGPRNAPVTIAEFSDFQ